MITQFFQENLLILDA